MSIGQVLRAVVTCDGCGVRFGEPVGYDNGRDAREAAAEAGWSFPPKLRANGEPAASSSDVCPACAPSWTPVPRMHVGCHRVPVAVIT